MSESGHEFLTPSKKKEVNWSLMTVYSANLAGKAHSGKFSHPYVLAPWTRSLGVPPECSNPWRGLWTDFSWLLRGL